ncbi:hypothetical protein [Dongia sedimenti]|uniref:Lipoprotein n=1 Tax=Dongia sedimenti TaxID=3064282 RepID=A0ABU0YSY7_9PROT|nr:hypothetical protein [Rhodospirillaceae bacterium R-7]
MPNLLEPIALRPHRTPSRIARAPIGLLGVALLVLFGCGGEADWRSKVIADAEAQIRARLGDPSAQFARVQVTGDSRSGQTCGIVTAKPAASAGGGTGRFIVYIDKGAGPFIEPSVGISTIAQAQFDFQWAHDCVGEGYRA